MGTGRGSDRWGAADLTPKQALKSAAPLTRCEMTPAECAHLVQIRVVSGGGGVWCVIVVLRETFDEPSPLSSPFPLSSPCHSPPRLSRMSRMSTGLIFLRSSRRSVLRSTWGSRGKKMQTQRAHGSQHVQSHEYAASRVRIQNG